MKKLFLILICCVLQSCVYNHSNSKDINLGNNIYYTPDGNESIIFLNLKKDGENKFGENLINPSSIYYHNIDSYILVKSKEVGESKFNYWVINKKDAEVIKKDSINFYKFIEGNSIDLNFIK